MLRHSIALLLTLLVAPLVLGADDDGRRCTAAVATMNQTRWEEGNAAEYDAYKRLVRETYDLCRRSEALTPAKVDAYRRWAAFAPDRNAAIAVLRDGVAELAKRHGDDAPELLPLLLQLGLVVANDDRAGGTAMLQRALAIQQKSYGETSEQVAEGHLHLASVAKVAKDFALAEHHYRTAVEIARKACGPECATLSTAIYSLLEVVKLDPQRATEAEALEQQWEAAIPKRTGRERKTKAQ